MVKSVFFQSVNIPVTLDIFGYLLVKPDVSIKIQIG